MSIRTKFSRRLGVFLGWSISSLIGFSVGAALSSFTAEDTGGYDSLLVAGLIVGFLQWLILRTYIQKAFYWIVLCPICWPISLFGALLVGLVLYGFSGYDDPGIVFIGAIAGIFYSSLQWILLRKRSGLQSGLWVLSNVAGFFLAGFIVFFVTNAKGWYLEDTTQFNLIAALSGFLPGLYLSLGLIHNTE